MDKSDLFMEISDILPLKKRRFFNFFAPFFAIFEILHKRFQAFKSGFLQH